MKLKIMPSEPAFEPLVLQLTLESKEEVSSAYQLGNWSLQVAAFLSEKLLNQGSGGFATKEAIHSILAPLFDAVTRLRGSPE